MMIFKCCFFVAFLCLHRERRRTADAIRKCYREMDISNCRLVWCVVTCSINVYFIHVLYSCKILIVFINSYCENLKHFFFSLADKLFQGLHIMMIFYLIFFFPFSINVFQYFFLTSNDFNDFLVEKVLEEDTPCLLIISRTYTF